MDLRLGLAEELGHVPPDLMVRLVHASVVEILADLLEDVVVAGLDEVRLDDLLCVGLRAVAGLAQKLSRPESEQLVAPGLDTEAKFLVMGVARLEVPLAVVQRHRILLVQSAGRNPSAKLILTGCGRCFEAAFGCEQALAPLICAHNRTTSRASHPSTIVKVRRLG